MISEKRAEARTRRSSGNVPRLVRRELQRTLPSYLMSGALNLILGLLTVSLVWSVAPGPSDLSGAPLPAFPADLLLLAIVANLSTNWTSKDYMQLRRDPFQEHLAFLRTLPVSAREAVLARIAVMLLSTAAMTVIFFGPFYLLSQTLGTGALGAFPGGASGYLCFVAIWTGYALISAGVLLYLELGVRGGGRKFGSLMLWTVLILAVVLLFGLLSETSLTAESLRLAAEHGPLAAAASVTAGAAGLGLAAAATVRRVERVGV